MMILRCTGDSDVAGDLGTYRARDGSPGARVNIDLDGSHVALVVGKSHTLGVLVEELAAADGVAPVVTDPMGSFATFADKTGFEIVVRLRVPASALLRLVCGVGCPVSTPRVRPGRWSGGRNRSQNARGDERVRLGRGRETSDSTVGTTTESVYAVRIRERQVTHGGGSPSASELRKG